MNWAATFTVHFVVVSDGAFCVADAHRLRSRGCGDGLFDGFQGCFGVGQPDHQKDQSLVDLVPTFFRSFGGSNGDFLFRVFLLVLSQHGLAQHERC